MTAAALGAYVVFEDEAHVAVLDLGENVEPVLGALAAVTGPQNQDLPAALRGDGQSHIDGTFGDRTLADLHVDGIDEDDRIDRGSRGRFCQSAMPSRTLSVMVEIVWRETSVP